MSKFIIRLDDICPTMHWDNYSRVEVVLKDNNIKPIIGVIPDNKDSFLFMKPYREDFWSYIKSLQEENWAIAMHGYQHLCTMQDGGLLKLSNEGEFAGRSYQEQCDMIQKGKEIFTKHDIETDTFMAPMHSFDIHTLAALKDAQFRFITDGYSLYPYTSKGITIVPQLFATPKHFGFGIYTICLHPNTMTDSHFASIKDFIEKNSQKFIRFPEAEKYTSSVIGPASRPFLKAMRKIKRLL